MSIRYIQHNNEEIMIADYRQCHDSKQQLALLEEVAESMKKKTEVRLLVDYTGIAAGVEYMSRLKTLGNTVFKDHMKCSAVLGIDGIKKILFNGYNRATGANNVKIFSNPNEAVKWLLQC
ncbi:MAG: hypothetical protein JXQ90_03575 [Cyclobacteriaceae bacterium]